MKERLRGNFQHCDSYFNISSSLPSKRHKLLKGQGSGSMHYLHLKYNNFPKKFLIGVHNWFSHIHRKQMQFLKKPADLWACLYNPPLDPTPKPLSRIPTITIHIIWALSFPTDLLYHRRPKPCLTYHLPWVINLLPISPIPFKEANIFIWILKLSNYLRTPVSPLHPRDIWIFSSTLFLKHRKSLFSHAVTDNISLL